MSRGYASSEFIGNVGKDPVVKRVGDKAMARFSIAVNYGKSKDGKEIVSWFPLVAWDKMAELIETYVTRGTSLHVRCTPSSRRYTDENESVREIIDFRIDHLTFLGGGEGSRRKEPQAEKSDFCPF